MDKDPAARSSSPRWIWPLLMLMMAAAISQAFGRLTLAIVLPQMTADYIGSYSRAGVASAANLGGYVVSTVVVTLIARRFESTRVLRYGLVFTLTGIMTVACTSSFPVLVAIQFVMGLGSGIVWLSCAPIAAAHAPPKQKGLAFGVMFSGIGVGVVLTGAIVWVVQHTMDPSAWRAVWVVEFVIGCATLLMLFLFMKPIGRPDEGQHGARSPIRDLYAVMVWVCIAYGLYGIAHGLYTTFLTAALHQDRGFTLSASANLYSLLGVSNLVGGVMLGRASDRFGRRPLMILACLAIIACAVLIPYGPLVLVFLSPVLYGLAMSGLPTVLTAYLSDVVKPGDMGTCYGAVTLTVGLGQLVAPPVGGWMADTSGAFSLTYEVAAAAALLAAGAIALCRSERSGRERSRRPVGALR